MNLNRKINRQLAENIFDRMDAEGKGFLNLENMKKLYESISDEHVEQIKESLRKFVIDHHRFSISKEEFLSLFPKKTIPAVYISLSHIQDAQRIKELSQTELKDVVNKRIETKMPGYQPKYIKKSRSSSRPVIHLQDRTKNKDVVFVRKAYFSLMS